MRRAPRRQARPSRSSPGSPGLDADSTINSGQVFLWERRGGFWYGIDGSGIVRVESATGRVRHSGAESDIFRKSDDVGGILAEISRRDAAVRRAVGRFPGLRLMRQDPFQCYISFIVSSNSSIQKIRKSLSCICRMFGEARTFDGAEFFTFPGPGALAGAEIPQLRKCGLGYRAGYVRDAAADVADGRIRLDRLKTAPYGDAREELLKVAGVGSKVADCIMLFSLEKTGAFPLDRWTLRILEKHHPGRFPAARLGLTEKRYMQLHCELEDYFGAHAGYAQQFLFKMERDDLGRGWLESGPAPAARPA